MTSTLRNSTSAASLRRKTRPRFTSGQRRIRVVDLFSGCGGLTLGVAQAARAADVALDVRLALDFEKAAADVYSANFPGAHVVHGSVEDIFGGDLGAGLAARERQERDRVGDVHLLLGGPPCQGHSNLNNRTRRSDPKNELYARMARAAAVLKPSVVLIENVPSVRYDTADVVQTTVGHLESLGYVVASSVVGLHALGVAQSRRRHVLIASRIDQVVPSDVLGWLTSHRPSKEHDLRWAIGDLVDLGEREGYDRIPQANEVNLSRMRYLLENDLYDLPNSERPECHRDVHSYKSMYGRLKWDEPAQTITSGFGSIGQGRYMHPSQLRALTAHEAARIQGFPDYFDFSRVTKRGELATMIGNAVPPALTREVATQVIPALLASDGAASPEIGQLDLRRAS
ncbi:DNA cytosine methyltransferase [Microbacterium sp. PRF11]|uniref:DNA cytosine methyltransferase n=1 Tax=Microbacterium sp. PRF11 TaxID=2962593 RepID=UPI00288290C5|nr:DNA cytosine methyltransferase [Microbacterium sp. PRF11]MDT0116589.1 DNA cytosine methyltransferase [Microbacterium sp. PRF11]